MTTFQWVMIGLLAVILIGYWMYRKKAQQ